MGGLFESGMNYTKRSIYHHHEEHNPIPEKVWGNSSYFEPMGYPNPREQGHIPSAIPAVCLGLETGTTYYTKALFSAVSGQDMPTLSPPWYDKKIWTDVDDEDYLSIVPSMYRHRQTIAHTRFCQDASALINHFFRNTPEDEIPEELSVVQLREILGEDELNKYEKQTDKRDQAERSAPGYVNLSRLGENVVEKEMERRAATSKGMLKKRPPASKPKSGKERMKEKRNRDKALSEEEQEQKKEKEAQRKKKKRAEMKAADKDEYKKKEAQRKKKKRAEMKDADKEAYKKKEALRKRMERTAKCRHC